MFEEIEQRKNRSALFTVLGVFVLLAMIAGVAVAAYTWSYTSDEANTIGTGNISMSLLESTDVIDIPDALPMADSQGMVMDEDNEMFDFAVTTSTSGTPGDISYTISISKISTVTEGYTQLTNDQVKVYLTKVEGTGDAQTETQMMAPKFVSEIITAGDTGVLPFDTDAVGNLTHNHSDAATTTTAKYRLRMWIDQSVDASRWTADTKQEYKLKISVSGSLNA